MSSSVENTDLFQGAREMARMWKESVRPSGRNTLLGTGRAVFHSRLPLPRELSALSAEGHEGIPRTSTLRRLGKNPLWEWEDLSALTRYYMLHEGCT